MLQRFCLKMDAHYGEGLGTGIGDLVSSRYFSYDSHTSCHYPSVATVHLKYARLSNINLFKFGYVLILSICSLQVILCIPGPEGNRTSIY